MTEKIKICAQCSEIVSQEWECDAAILWLANKEDYRMATLCSVLEPLQLPNFIDTALYEADRLISINGENSVNKLVENMICRILRQYMDDKAKGRPFKGLLSENTAYENLRNLDSDLKHFEDPTMNS